MNEQDNSKYTLLAYLALNAWHDERKQHADAKNELSTATSERDHYKQELENAEKELKKLNRKPRDRKPTQQQLDAVAAKNGTDLS